MTLLKQLTDGALETKAQLAARAAAIPETLTPEDLAALWNILAEAVGLHRSLALNAARRTAARNLLKEHPERAYWIAVLRKIGRSQFCRGENDRGWVANIDFLLRRSTYLKVLEGKYDDRSTDRVGDPMQKYWRKGDVGT